MDRKLEETIGYYKKQGAPSDQTALTALLTEIQRDHGGTIPGWTVPVVAEALDTKQTLLLALIRRMPRLRLADTHLLEVCAGPNCGKHAALVKAAEQLGGRVEVRFVPCMRMCGKGPNIRLDGKIHHRADPELLQELLKEL